MIAEGVSAKNREWIRVVVDKLALAVRSQPQTEGRPMAFVFKLEAEDGTPVEPRTYRSAVPNWGRGDTIPLGQGRTLVVVELRPSRDEDPTPVLVVAEGAI